jgi:nucleotide-binding universal stress UspA family protein
MQSILVAVDGSGPSERAVKHVIALHASGMSLRVLLLNVQLPWAPAISSEEVREGKRRHARAMARATRSARALLGRAKIPYSSRMVVGDEAASIVKLARAQRCDQIVLGMRGRGAVARVVFGSVSMKTLQLADTPVTLVK